MTDKKEDHYHKIAVLVCDQCSYLEYPGCSSHCMLLTNLKGNGHLSCNGCENEAKEKEAKGDYDYRSYIAATDISEPWCEGNNPNNSNNPNKYYNHNNPNNPNPGSLSKL